MSEVKKILLQATLPDFSPDGKAEDCLFGVTCVGEDEQIVFSSGGKVIKSLPSGMEIYDIEGMEWFSDSETAFERAKELAIKHDCPFITLPSFFKLLKLKEKSMKPVNKYTRARRHIGREIACPLCNYGVTVYHFAWSAITCQKCKADVDKEKWLVVDDKEKSK